MGGSVREPMSERGRSQWDVSVIQQLGGDRHLVPPSSAPAALLHWRLSRTDTSGERFSTPSLVAYTLAAPVGRARLVARPLDAKPLRRPLEMPRGSVVDGSLLTAIPHSVILSPPSGPGPNRLPDRTTGPPGPRGCYLKRGKSKWQGRDHTPVPGGTIGVLTRPLSVAGAGTA